jgi:hypothetical protein
VAIGLICSRKAARRWFRSDGPSRAFTNSLWRQAPFAIESLHGPRYPRRPDALKAAPAAFARLLSWFEMLCAQGSAPERRRKKEISVVRPSGRSPMSFWRYWGSGSPPCRSPGRRSRRPPIPFFGASARNRAVAASVEPAPSAARAPRAWTGRSHLLTEIAPASAGRAVYVRIDRWSADRCCALPSEPVLKTRCRPLSRAEVFGQIAIGARPSPMSVTGRRRPQTADRAKPRKNRAILGLETARP